MNGRRTGPACNQVGSFVNQVQQLVQASALSPTLGQALANAANALQAALDCSLRPTFPKQNASHAILSNGER